MVVVVGFEVFAVEDSHLAVDGQVVTVVVQVHGLAVNHLSNLCAVARYAIHQFQRDGLLVLIEGIGAAERLAYLFLNFRVVGGEGNQFVVFSEGQPLHVNHALCRCPHAVLQQLCRHLRLFLCAAHQCEQGSGSDENPSNHDKILLCIITSGRSE